MSTALVFNVQGDASAFAAAIETRTGPYPKPCLYIGGGRHVSAVLARTLRHGDVHKHPTLNLWRFPFDRVVREEVARGLVVPPSGSEQTITPDWF